MNKLIIIVWILISIVLSLFVHELGHYTVAKAYGWETEIGIFSNDSIAYVTAYPETRTDAQSLVFLSAGLLFNLLFIFICLVFVHFTRQHNQEVRVFLYILAFFNLVLFIMNSYPSVGSDGYQIVSILGL